MRASLYYPLLEKTYQSRKNDYLYDFSGSLQLRQTPRNRDFAPFSRIQPRPPRNQFRGSQSKSTKVDSYQVRLISYY
jgi:hypothetical protein